MTESRSYFTGKLHEFVAFARKRPGDLDLAADAVQREPAEGALKAAGEIREGGAPRKIAFGLAVSMLDLRDRR